ncbi:MAG: glycoside hydrolase family 2 protein [Terriglobales bacterium]
MKTFIAAVTRISCVFLLSIISVAQNTRIPLQHGWALQSSKQVTETGDVISSPSYSPKKWIATSVPATVVAAQDTAGEFEQYGDLFTAMNLRKLPGMTYKIGDIFNLRDMSPDSPYAVPWWYRTQFVLTPAQAKKRVSIHFNGINARANLWLNGKQFADAKDVAGAYHIQEFDITPLVKAGKNTLAVQVFAPTVTDFSINFVDWNPTPPDKNMGLWQDVYLTTSGPVTVRYPQVITNFPSDSTDTARLTVNADLQNLTDQPVEGTLVAELGPGESLKQPVKLDAHEARTVSFTADQFPALNAKNPKLWWPVQMGAPNLHKLNVRFLIGNALSDEASIRYGIREITSELTPKGGRLFKVNHKPVLIRGGGWAQDMLMRHPAGRLESQIEYVRAMNLNTIRLEGQLEEDKFFDLADEKGLLVMAGWCCCDIWEGWQHWQPGMENIATASLRSQMRRLRSHASMLVWLNGSDGPPPADVEQAYLQVERETNWPNPTLSSASAVPTTVTGASGVKMTGPYDYETPNYWLTDTNRKWGGAWGFNTETSPGPAIPVEDSLRKFIPKDKLWPINDVWNFHAGGERFMTVDRFNEGMDKTYGPAKDLDDYEKKAQAMAYDGERAMFEAYSKNKYDSTGVIQWMMDNAWPSMIWHLYDYYLQPGGGYFGTKKACEPLHIQFSYDDRSIVVVNGFQEPHKNLKATVAVLDVNLKHVFDKEATVDVDPDSTKPVATVPDFPDTPAVYFVKLTLADSANRVISTNFYWIPAQFSVVDWAKTPDTAWSPMATFEDMTALNNLPKSKIQATAALQAAAGRRAVRVKLRNPSDKLAFQVRLSLRDAATKEEVLPVLWDDNYVSLMPGESREIEARYLAHTKVPAKLVLRVDGWNVDTNSVPVGGK